MAHDTNPQPRPIVTRAEAKAAGLSRFFTGRPCRKGHFSERWVIGKGRCIACASSRKKAAAARSRSKPWPPRPTSKRCLVCNEEKPGSEFYRQRASADGIQARCIACKKAEAATYYAANPEKCRAATVNYRAANPEKAHTSMIAWQTAYPDRLKRAMKAWQTANPEANRANQHNRRARKRKAGGKYKIADIRALYKKQKGRCPYCRVSLKGGYHTDHIVPLSKGGTNWISNIQLTCKKCNLKKHSRDPIDFAQLHGLLL